MFTDTSDIVALLRADHNSLREMICKIKFAEGIEDQRTAFNNFLPVLECQTFAQEESLMARALSEIDLRPFAMEILEEHDVTEFMAAKVKQAANNDQWLARVAVLCRVLEQQLRKEDHEFLAAVEQNLGIEERAELGERYTNAKEKLKLAPIIEMPIRASALQAQSG